jgi:hypothetical protein
MAALTDAAAAQVLQWVTAQAATAPVAPLVVALETVQGDDVTPGTEVVGGGYTRQLYVPTTPTTAAGITSVRNAQLIRFENMPAVTVVSFSIWDSAPTRSAGCTPRCRPLALSQRVTRRSLPSANL